MKSALPPVVLFSYNRPDHTRRALESLRAARGSDEADVIVFSDGAKNDAAAPRVAELRRYLGSFRGFRSFRTVERESNFGLSRSIRSGLDEIFNDSPSVIVLEDDLELAPRFLEFMGEALHTYQPEADIFSVSGWSPGIPLPADYSLPVYLSQRALCWGWGTWKDRWKGVDWDVPDYPELSKDRKALRALEAAGEDLPSMLAASMAGRIDSWAVRWAVTQLRQGKYSVVPVRSFIQNLGHDDSGTHSKSSRVYRGADMEASDWSFSPLPGCLHADPRIFSRIRQYYAFNWRGKLKKRLGLL